MNLAQRKKIDQIPEADLYDLKEAIRWINKVVENPDQAVSVTAEFAPSAEALQKVTSVLLGLFPEKITLTLVIIQDLLMKVLDAQYNKEGKKRKIGWMQRALIGGKTIIAISKIVKILTTK